TRRSVSPVRSRGPRTPPRSRSPSSDPTPGAAGIHGERGRGCAPEIPWLARARRRIISWFLIGNWPLRPWGGARSRKHDHVGAGRPRGARRRRGGVDAPPPSAVPHESRPRLVAACLYLESLEEV